MNSVIEFNDAEILFIEHFRLFWVGYQARFDKYLEILWSNVYISHLNDFFEVLNENGSCFALFIRTQFLDEVEIGCSSNEFFYLEPNFLSCLEIHFLVRLEEPLFIDKVIVLLGEELLNALIEFLLGDF